MAAAAPVLSVRPPALWIAARDGETEEARQLLAEEADIEERGGPSECTPLHVAAYRGHEDLVLLLLEHGADSSSKNNAGWTSLHWAAEAGPKAVVQLILHNGADLQSRTHFSVLGGGGQTPEDVAILRQRPQIVAMLQAEPARREAVRRAQCEAFAMGHHERLGAGSRVQGLDAGVVRMVLEYL